jgi:hypothetical protein
MLGSGTGPQQGVLSLVTPTVSSFRLGPVGPAWWRSQLADHRHSVHRWQSLLGVSVPLVDVRTAQQGERSERERVLAQANSNVATATQAGVSNAFAVLVPPDVVVLQAVRSMSSGARSEAL